MCVLTENVRAGADSVQRDTGRLWFINTNQCVYIRHKLRIGGLYTVSTLALTHTHTNTHTYTHYPTCLYFCIAFEVSIDCLLCYKLQEHDLILKTTTRELSY